MLIACDDAGRVVILIYNFIFILILINFNYIVLILDFNNYSNCSTDIKLIKLITKITLLNLVIK